MTIEWGDWLTKITASLVVTIITGVGASQIWLLKTVYVMNERGSASVEYVDHRVESSEQRCKGRMDSMETRIDRNTNDIQSLFGRDISMTDGDGPNPPPLPRDFKTLPALPSGGDERVAKDN